MKNKTYPVYIAIGSNIDAHKNIKLALKELSILGQIAKISKLIKTKPVGYTKQADFLNGAILFYTNLTPIDLLKKLKEIEKKLKRNTPFRNGPRTIDLDIIFYSNLLATSSRYSLIFKC